MSQFSFADSVRSRFKELLSEFGRVCEWRKLRVNVNERKVIRFSSEKKQVS